MADAVARRQIRDLRIRLGEQGAANRQIALALMARFKLTPLAAFRHAAGLSQSQVADRYNERWPGQHPKTFKQVSYWERWQGPGSSGTTSSRPPSYEDLRRLAVLYDCLIDDLLSTTPAHDRPAEVVGDAAEIISAVLSGRYAEGPEGDENGPDIALLVPVGEGTVTVKLSRRHFTELLAAGGLAALLPEAGLAARMETGSATAAYYRHFLIAHQSNHHLLDPRTHITALRQVLQAVDQQRAQDSAPGPRAELRLVQGEYAEHISWLYRETGDLAACRTWASQAAGWALEGGDTTMSAYMMLRGANLALDQGDPQQAIELASTTQSLSLHIPPVLRAVALAYEARGHALTGVLESAKLDQAAELITDDTTSSEQGYLRFYDTDFVDVQRAACYVAAGPPERAVTILQGKITGLPASHARDRGVYLARLGAAHAAGHVPDAAAHAGMGSLAEARHTSSRHVLAELGRLDATLMREWPHQPKVRQFHEALHDTLAA